MKVFSIELYDSDGVYKVIYVAANDRNEAVDVMKASYNETRYDVMCLEGAIFRTDKPCEIKTRFCIEDGKVVLSEDERIRGAIIDHLKDNDLIEWASWLEKQGEQKHAELPKGEDYGIDSLWHAQSILEKTLGKVEGYQSDDGILEHECAINAVKELYEQKPAWSEEDTERIEFISALCTDKQGECSSYSTMYRACSEAKDWLNSLKDRIHHKQEWSEEDEAALGDALWCCKQAASIAKDENDMGNIWYAERWLKSIKERINPQWNPSEEQLDALHDAALYIDNSMFPHPKGILMKFYKQLKKLREE